MKWPPLASVLVAMGCSNNPAALLADEGEASRDSGTREVDAAGEDAAPAEPAELDPYQAALRIYGEEEACVACIERECESEARACAQNDACTEDARCRAACDGNPHCQTFECNDRYPFDDRPTGPFEEGCVQTKCIEDCRIGHDFACVGSYPAYPPQADAPVAFSLQLSDGPTVMPFLEAGLRARLCEWGDLDCVEPVGDEFRSDAEGAISMSFPPARRFAFQLRAFQGYLELTDPDTDPPRTAPVLYVPWVGGGVPAAPPAPNMTPWPLAVASESVVALTEALLQVEMMPNRGWILANVWDCRASHSWRASGLTLEIPQGDAETSVLYGVSVAATETDRLGAAIAINVPPGVVTLRMLHSGTQVILADVPVRAGALTFVILLPTPAM